MAAIKAILLGALITGALFLIVIWIIPVMTFLIVFGVIAGIAYAIIRENQRSGSPHK
jgi:hypothetical protein